MYRASVLGHVRTEVFLQPGSPSSVPIAPMNRVRGVVAGDRVGDELCLHAIVPKDVVEDERFRYRNTLVARVAEHKRRCLDARRVGCRSLFSLSLEALRVFER